MKNQAPWTEGGRQFLYAAKAKSRRLLLTGWAQGQRTEYTLRSNYC